MNNLKSLIERMRQIMLESKCPHELAGYEEEASNYVYVNKEIDTDKLVLSISASQFRKTRRDIIVSIHIPVCTQ